MTNPKKNRQKRKSQTGPSSTKPKKQAIKERRTQPKTTVDLTGPAEISTWAELEKWGNNPEKVSVVMTDNASNMIAAFKLYDKKLEECVTEEAMVQRMPDE
ncbi:hypothetical protein RvY_07304 [Ramazzottius varieornatus]|uniref:Uncharacterized protein n=1 Tax=Ramazzottius varieornatus TaxID=947166 RepID=A0A1D1V1V3_RAMVA|nr:hypothetical protein RvY_07304 [Ramazzottius varieornatus]